MCNAFSHWSSEWCELASNWMRGTFPVVWTKAARRAEDIHSGSISRLWVRACVLQMSAWL